MERISAHLSALRAYLQTRRSSHWLLASGGSAFLAVVVLLAQHSRDKLRQREIEEKAQRKREQRGDQEEGKTNKHAVDKDFKKNLWMLLKIVFPSLYSKEVLLLLLHTSFLIARTFLSIFVANLDGAIVRTLVGRNGKAFAYYLSMWVCLAIPATYVNSMIKYLESKLSIAFRTRLVLHCYDIYMKDEVYYRVGNLDNRLTNADQSLTEDVSKFCTFLAHLYSQLSKPIFDCLLMSFQLIRSARSKSDSGSVSGASVFGILIVLATHQILGWVRPSFGVLSSKQQKKDGKLRFVHSRLITNCEEIAFYRGHELEKNLLEKTYLSLVKHMNHVFNIRIIYNTWEGFFTKYIWSITGLLMHALPAFFGDDLNVVANASDSDRLQSRTQAYITSRGLLLSISEAIERIMLALKDVSELSGYTQRVADMLKVFEDVANQKYVKSRVKEGVDGVVDVTTMKGEVVEGNEINFEAVPIITPSGDVLVEQLDLRVQPGMHVLITGPNGCGKSSLFRILGGLWPTYGGKLTRPHLKSMFYIPQKPYLSSGNLREQFIYPDTIADMQAKGKSDQDLENILKEVDLGHILNRVGGWNSVQDWINVLSGGEKQRVGMARLFYHKPSFAILDECTSQVSQEIEGAMYTHAKEIGITLLTVSHRSSLWKFHDWLLRYDGEGGLDFSPLNAGTLQSLQEEKQKLEEQLEGISSMEVRLKHLCSVLGEDSEYLLNKDKENLQPDTSL